LRLVRQQETGQVDQIVKQYAKFRRTMKKKGVEDVSSEGPIDFAERCMTRFPQWREQINTITQSYVAIRYGGNPNRQLEKRFKLAVKALAKA